MRGAVLALALAFAACGRSPEAVERARVLAAIDALRDAPSADPIRRRGLLEALERTPAATPAAAAAREACAAAYRHLFDGDDLAVELRRTIDRGGPVPPDVPRKLLEAEANVAQARILMPGCERALADLRRAAMNAARPP